MFTRGTRRRLSTRIAVITVFTGVLFTGTPAVAADVRGEQVPVVPVEFTFDYQYPESPIELRARASFDGTGLAIVVTGIDGSRGVHAPYSNCVRPTQGDADTVVCVFPDAELAEGDVVGLAPSTPMTLLRYADERYPGPVDICSPQRDAAHRGCGYTAYQVDAVEAERLIGNGEPLGNAPAQLANHTASGEDWTYDGAIVARTTPRTADLLAHPQNLIGEVGDERTIWVELSNVGEADWLSPDYVNGNAGLTVVLPTGVEALDPGPYCVESAPGVYTCDIRDIRSGDNCFHGIDVRITDTGPHEDGSIHAETAPGPNAWYTVDLDADPSNNGATVTVNNGDEYWPPREYCDR
ncbi:hypothetical protein [Stackebrandtia soli]|uniref:hypothetical protein n=1 Tax=Stackebrandtia soli TaxID=1892856 RepID=UPI0039E9AA19